MKSKHFGKKLITAMLALIMVVSVVSGCSSNKTPGDSTDSTAPAEKVYTYNEYIQKFPNSWSTHNATSDADSYVQGYTEMGLYAYTLSEDKSTYAFIDEMAKGDPVNVTAVYKDQYGIKETDITDNLNVGKAWEITLNPDATWENGEKITADDYVWSMERVIAPEMKNSLSSTFITGEMALYNANNYYISGYQESYHKVMEKKVYTDEELLALVDNGVLYFSFDTHVTDDPTSMALSKNHSIEKMKAHYQNTETGEDVYDILYNKYASAANEYGYIKITRDNYEDFKTQLSVLSASALKAFFPNWYVLLSLKEVVSPAYTKILAATTYTDEEIDNLINEGKLFFSFQSALMDSEGSHTVESYHNLKAGKKFFTDADGVDHYVSLYEKYASVANEFGYIQITQRNKADFIEHLGILTTTALSKYVPNWYSLCSVVSYAAENATSTTFADVGIFKTGDANDKFVMVFKNAVSMYQVKNLLTKNWIVYKPYYEEGYTQQGALTLTTYGAISGKYMGYGPYKLESFQKDKQLVFTRNEGWYGYNENATNYHEGQFMTDRIVCQVISDQATALLEYEKGNLDSVRLTSTDMDKYKFSDYLLKRTGGNTWSINFNTDAAALEALEADGLGNRRILSVAEFRKAFSLCLERRYIGQNILVGSAPAYSFINSNYYYDLENDPNSIYRNSDQAKQCIVDLYGVEYGEGKTYATLDEAYRAISGYDIDEAKNLFTEAYNKAVEAGLYANGQNIKIIIYNNTVSASHTALANYIQQQINTATTGTPLEGKISVEFKESATRLDDMKNGKVEAIYHSYIADYNNPNGMIAKFTDLQANTSVTYGFDPTTETFDITCDFDGDGTVTTETKTYDQWQKSIAAGGTYATASNEVRLTILSKLENQLLGGFRTLPLCVGTDLTLRSKKVNYATENANIFVAFGGVRLLTYNYDDAEWAKVEK